MTIIAKIIVIKLICFSYTIIKVNLLVLSFALLINYSNSIDLGFNSVKFRHNHQNHNLL